MTDPKTALLLIGSAKPAGESSSEALGAYLLGRLAERGISTETSHVAHALRTEARTSELLLAVDRTDLLILAFPLYVDSLPYLATEALERIAAHRLAQPAPAPASFLAIANCGFPEAQHNATALAICRQFADAAGFTWAGGLALGEGGAISGRPLAAAGGMAPQRRGCARPRRRGAGRRRSRDGRGGRSYGAALHPRVGLHTDGGSRLVDAGAAQSRFDTAGRAAVRSALIPPHRI